MTSEDKKPWFNGAVRKMAWPLVSWMISSSSSSSSSSSDYEEDEDEISCQANHMNDDDDEDSSAGASILETPPQSLSRAVTVAFPPGTNFDSLKRRRIDSAALAALTPSRSRVEKTQTASTTKRVNWTPDDELRLLRSYLDYTSRRWNVQQHTTSDLCSFYDRLDEPEQELKLRFSKSQVVEKLRRLKRKYQNAPAAGSRNPHERAALEISKKIWRINWEEEESGEVELHDVRVKCEEEDGIVDGDGTVLLHRPHAHRSRSGVNDGGDTPAGRVLALAKKPIPVSLEGKVMGGGDEAVDEKWKKQQIMELEVYSKRLELVQEQVKTTLDRLRSLGQKDTTPS